MFLFIIYLIIVNAAGFLLMHIDKHRARKNLWRIPEKTLLTVALLGGSLGCLSGIQTAKHKTNHPKFFLGIPIMLALQIILVGIILIKFTF